MTLDSSSSPGAAGSACLRDVFEGGWSTRRGRQSAASRGVVGLDRTDARVGRRYLVLRVCILVVGLCVA